jgi:diguanylate cyclase (GGDEF)-like protein
VLQELGAGKDREVLEMERRLLVMNSKDNVGVLLEQATAGDTCSYNGDLIEMTVDIEFAHKVALMDIPATERVIKYGHEIGDELLAIAAERLRTSLRSCDIIGRPGGDEFVALVPDVKGDIAEKLATRLTTCLEQPYLIGRRKLDCAASIGLALYPDHARTLTGLLRAADAAMYRAKARCRGADSINDTDLLEKAV